MTYEARVYVTLKEGVLDPEGRVIQERLAAGGRPHVEQVKTGRFYQITVTAASEEEARAEVDAMCRELLAHSVTQTYTFTLDRV